MVRAKVKGHLIRLNMFDDVKTTPTDEAWIEEKLRLLAQKGLVNFPKPSAPKPSRANGRWFKQFLKKNGAKGNKSVEFAPIEKKHKIILPRDYKDFVSIIGRKAFVDVSGIEGTKANVLQPARLDFKNFRRGKVDNLEGDDAKVDGVMFAEMDNGDCFVFDVSAKGSDYPVFWYRHEENTMEAFAADFAECIKRFAEKN